MRNAFLLRAFVALLMIPAWGASAAVPEKGGARNYDARVELNRSFQAAPAPSQLQAAADLRREIPDLGVTFNAETGATRSLLSYVGFLSGPQSGDATSIGLGFVRSNLDLLGLSEADLADMETTDTVYSAVSGATYVYFRQRHEGLSLYNGQLHFGVSRDGRVMIVNNQFLPGLAAAVNAVTPSLGAPEAVASAARHLGLEAAAVSLEPVRPALMLLAIRQGEARLVWNFQVHTPDLQHVYDMNVDAVDGRVWTRFDWVAADSYKVYDRPVEAPIYTTPPPPADARTTAVNPAHLPASPFGWHDTDGAPGPEFTITRGNNVHAYPDRVAPDGPPGDLPSPDGGAGLVFDFPLDLTQPPSAYVPAAVTNLFHWNNLIHDIQHRYGFDAPAGNFQVNNYGLGGLGNDDVRAEAQDFSGTNNANFFTPIEGQRPRMQMYIGTNPTPDVDGDLDNLVIVHEYGHGISNRLVGGPFNVSCLNNAQQPGEGLSDWWGLFYTGEIGDQGIDRRTVGNYLFGQPVGGPGIRPFPYSTDNTINPDTYASVAGRAVPHGVGAVWAQGYWEVYWRLIGQYGFDIDLYNATGNAGNQRAGLYINEGLKATICTPAFTDVRDGIVAAAATLHNGEDVCRLWAGFAAFGLGIDAVSGGPNGLNPTNGFQLPPACRPAAPTSLVATATAPNRITLNWTAAAGAVSYRVYRAIGACPQPTYTQIAAGVTATTYDDNTVSGGTTYAYVVTSVDANGIESVFSNCDDATATGACTLAPTFAGAQSVTQPTPGVCRLDVHWAAGTHNCGTALVYNVYRSTDPAFVPAPANLRQSCVSGTTFPDLTVVAGNTYYYIVRAEDNTTSGNGACNLGNQDANLVRRSGSPNVVTVFDGISRFQGCVVPSQSVAAQALAVDAAGNDVLQPNETVTMAPTWRNTGNQAITLTGATSAFAGPAGGTYNNPDSTGAYGTINIGGQAACTDCYTVEVAAASRPVTHWDSTILETVNPTATTKTWTLHIGDSFTDVLPSSNFYRFIETILHKNVTGGCTTTTYCPLNSTTREQMAVFVLVSKEAPGYLPPACAPPNMFTDVPESSPFCRWIEELANRGVVGGCAPGLYCPSDPATREQMSVFVLRTLDPTLSPVTCITGSEMFADVPATSPFCRWIQELARRGVVTGCGGGNYCPTASVTREQMSVFLAVTFTLTLYGL